MATPSQTSKAAAACLAAAARKDPELPIVLAMGGAAPRSESQVYEITDGIAKRVVGSVDSWSPIRVSRLASLHSLCIMFVT